MNRSYSKLRHIQESNQKLENRIVENKPGKPLSKFTYTNNKGFVDYVFSSYISTTKPDSTTGSKPANRDIINIKTYWNNNKKILMDNWLRKNPTSNIEGFRTLDGEFFYSTFISMITRYNGVVKITPKQ